MKAIRENPLILNLFSENYINNGQYSYGCYCSILLQLTKCFADDKKQIKEG